MKQILTVFCCALLSNHLIAMEVENVNSTQNNSTAMQSYYLIDENDEEQIPIHGSYRDFFRSRFESANSESLKMPLSQQRVREIAQVLDNIKCNKYFTVDMLCKQKPLLTNTLTFLGLKKILSPISLESSNLKTIPKENAALEQFFLHYHEDCATQQKKPQDNQILCMSTPHNPYIVVLKKDFQNNTYLTWAEIVKSSKQLAYKLLNRTLSSDPLFAAIEAVEVTPDGKQLIAQIGTTLYFINTENGEKIHSLDIKKPIKAFAITPTGGDMLVVTDDRFIPTVINNRYENMHGKGPLLPDEIAPHTLKNITILALSPTLGANSWFCIGTQDGFVGYYSWSRKNIITQSNSVQISTNKITSIVIKKNNEIIVADENAQIYFWSPNMTKINKLPIAYPNKGIRRMALIDSEKHLLIEMFDKTTPSALPILEVVPTDPDVLE